MRPRISIRGCVHPFVRWSIGPLVQNTFVKKVGNWIKLVEKSVYKVSKGVQKCSKVENMHVGASVVPEGIC